MENYLDLKEQIIRLFGNGKSVRELQKLFEIHINVLDKTNIFESIMTGNFIIEQILNEGDEY